MILKPDCKYFPGDRPCDFNKFEGIMCDNCNHYNPINFKILIIKLDAIGDVLRTTCILPALRKKYPDAHITWLTKSNSVDLFKHNPFVDRVLEFEDSKIIPLLKVEYFDLIIHPDASPQSAAPASYSNSENKKGFILNKKGKVIPANKDAEEWFEMGAFDQYKKKNKKSYQQILFEICGLEFKGEEIQLFLSQEEIELKENIIRKLSLSDSDLIIGLNTGASRRWQYKQWRLDGYIDLVREIRKNFKVEILLFGGPEEIERNEILLQHFPDLINTGTNNTLRQFFAKLDLADIIVTGDTMALHAAAALKKDVVCLFGPTSYNEIYDYGRIAKVYPDMDCLVCYKPECDFDPTCMDNITVDMVYTEIEKIIKRKLK
ncbi:MAG: glycosyltransferase family 9 protein [Ignavibacteriae bacterium]|nr:glycosyltransferase family 9 protein [Ignavibacteriota bacterium]NOG97771.1 glycosyltransferase family 9 protein [Ignavibacteriota bacterium]